MASLARPPPKKKVVRAAKVKIPADAWGFFEGALRAIFAKWWVLRTAVENNWGEGGAEGEENMLNDLFENFHERWQKDQLVDVVSAVPDASLPRGVGVRRFLAHTPRARLTRLASLCCRLKSKNFCMKPLSLNFRQQMRAEASRR